MIRNIDIDTYKNRLVHNSIMSYDKKASDGTFRLGVMKCFLTREITSKEAIEAFMEYIFRVLKAELDHSYCLWCKDMTFDEMETAIHNGLRFTARVDRHRRFREINRLLMDGQQISPRWPAGPLTPGSPKTEDERLAANRE